MKVRELIEKLKEFDGELEVRTMDDVGDLYYPELRMEECFPHEPYLLIQ